MKQRRELILMLAALTKVGKTTLVVAPKNVDVSSIEAIVATNED